MAVQLRASDVIRRIVERVDLDEFTERVLDSFWERPEYQRFRPLREDVRAWVRWNIDLMIRWLVDGQPPTESDLERFRERARMLAANGMPPDIVPANFRRGARYAWTAILDAAREDERAALVESADLLFEFIDRVSQLFSDTYESAGPAATISEEERRAQALIARACAGEEPSGEDLQLGERIGFELSGAYRPFVMVAPAWSVQRHDARRAAARRTCSRRRKGAASPGWRTARSLARARPGPARVRSGQPHAPRRAARGVRGAARGRRRRRAGRPRRRGGRRPPRRAAAAALAASGHTAALARVRPARRPRPELTRTLDA